MSYIELDSVSLSFSILRGHARSFKKSLIRSVLNPLFPKLTNKLFDPIIKIDAIKNISLTINDGSRIGLIGRNGAGKSTLLKLITGIYPPTSGKVNCEGKITCLSNMSLGLNRDENAYENIIHKSVMHGLTLTNIKTKMDAITASAGLADRLNDPIRTYSAGMSMRLASAISMNMNADILLIDEVFNTLDIQGANQFNTLLHEKINNCKILIMASHILDNLKQYCDKIIWLENGAIKDFGAAEKIIALYKEHEATIIKRE